MLLPQLNAALAGQPEQLLRLILLAIAAFAVGVALYAPPAVKLIVAGWLIAP